MSFFVHYFTDIFLLFLQVPGSVLSVLSVLIAHNDISVHRCTVLCISVLISVSSSFFQKHYLCTLREHWCRVHIIHYDEHFLLYAILDVYWCARKTQHVRSVENIEFTLISYYYFLRAGLHWYRKTSGRLLLASEQAS